ncbi:hypothetical protein [Paraclostridium sordellii]|nr:hypothetical protein [Paeniclostridium sordellii]
MTNILLGASVTLNIILIGCWKIMFNSIKKEVEGLKKEIEVSYKK